jgi:hypothetical protein
MATTTRQLCLDALQEIRVVSAVEAGQPEDLDFALRRLNRILDAWNADGLAIYANQTLVFPIAPGVNPQTIGPTGLWVVPVRPQTILAANLIQGGNIRVPITLHDQAWWMQVGAPTTQVDTLNDAYYSPAWPNGQLFCAQTPGSADPVELLIRVHLSQAVFTDVFSMPPGYQDALTLTLAEALAAPLRADMPPGLPFSAQRARAIAFEANTPTPPLITTDFGIPGGAPGYWDWRTGEWR